MNRGDLIETPYGQGVVLEVFTTPPGEPERYKVNVSGTEYVVKSVGVKPIGRIELP
jgi:hypothetical protein